LRKIKYPQGNKAPEWLLDQKKGLFIIVRSLHCIGVNCCKRQIFDCSEKFSLFLNLNNLNILTPHIEDIREVVRI